MKKSYYAIIPADVRYDKELTPNSKLLYGEITALANEKGYCWASNSYFGELYGVSKETASRWISALEKPGHIKTQLVYENGTKVVKERRIYLPHTPIDNNVNTPPQNNQDPIDRNVNTPIDEKLKDNNTSFNNTFNNTVVEVVVEDKVKEKYQVKNKNIKQETTTASNITIKDIAIAFEQNGFGTISGYVREELITLMDEHPPEWILDAIKEAVECNVRNLKYTKAILKRWKAEGKNKNKEATRSGTSNNELKQSTRISHESAKDIAERAGVTSL